MKFAVIKFCCDAKILLLNMPSMRQAKTSLMLKAQVAAQPDPAQACSATVSQP